MTMLQAEIEELIDRAGIEDFLVALSEVCGVKAEHIETNRQDLPLARRWAALDGAINRAIPKASGL